MIKNFSIYGLSHIELAVQHAQLRIQNLSQLFVGSNTLRLLLCDIAYSFYLHWEMYKCFRDRSNHDRVCRLSVLRILPRNLSPGAHLFFWKPTQDALDYNKVDSDKDDPVPAFFHFRLPVHRVRDQRSMRRLIYARLPHYFSKLFGRTLHRQSLATPNREYCCIVGSDRNGFY